MQNVVRLYLSDSKTVNKHKNLHFKVLVYGCVAVCMSPCFMLRAVLQAYLCLTCLRSGRCGRGCGPCAWSTQAKGQGHTNLLMHSDAVSQTHSGKHDISRYRAFVRVFLISLTYINERHKISARVKISCSSICTLFIKTSNEYNPLSPLCL